MFLSKLHGMILAVRFVCQCKRERRAFERMTLTQARELEDEALTTCVITRMGDYDKAELKTVAQPLRVVYTVFWYQIEVNNGGLCQYFANHSAVTAPYLEQALYEVGAKKHLDLFHRFVTENGIDVRDLSSFKLERVEDFEEQEKRYPFDQFDDAFYALEEEKERLSDALACYIRQHLTDFFEA